MTSKTIATATKTIKAHSQFTEVDYTYLSDKGYSNREIKSIWDREIGQDPQQHDIYVGSILN